MTSREKALVAARAASDKKATDIVIQDVAELLKVTDYFVLATGNTRRQVDAIVEGVEEMLTERAGVKPDFIEGLDEMAWVLLDYGDIVVHVFQPEVRDFYRLETLWGTAKVVDIHEAGIEDAIYSERIEKYLESSDVEETPQAG